MSKFAKSTIGFLIKTLPLVAVVVLSYILFISPDAKLSEGVKLSASALLGAIASYVFVEYAKFIERVEARKTIHSNALTNLEFKLNEQMNWLSDVILQLLGHEQLLKRVIAGEVTMAHDASSYREAISIEAEAYNLAHIGYKNELLSLITLYRKLQNDIASHQGGYEFMLNNALADTRNLDSYRRGLPFHLARTDTLRKHTEFVLSETKLALSKCRVLSSDYRSLIAIVGRYLFQQSDPSKYKERVQTELDALEREIEETIKKSQEKINRVENT